ncbi:MAG TPA: hypothetical protein VME22_12660 [Solirubrobacteraceae bacterium]|nr:hypothetical protein [Solirubrobacteraceae bacterium]
MAETDPDRLADELEQEADDLERRSKKLEQRIDEASQEWQHKRTDPNVPGAPPPAEDEDQQSGE